MTSDIRRYTVQNNCPHFPIKFENEWRIKYFNKMFSWMENYTFLLIFVWIYYALLSIFSTVFGSYFNHILSNKCGYTHRTVRVIRFKAYRIPRRNYCFVLLGLSYRLIFRTRHRVRTCFDTQVCNTRANFVVRK